jgi:hypothetical protein
MIKESMRMISTLRTLLTTGCVIGASALAPSIAPPLQAQGPPLAENVTVLESEDLPAALVLSAFVSRADKLAEHDLGFAPVFFEKYGLTLSEGEIVELTQLYGDFDERQGERHQREMPAAQNRPDLAEQLSLSLLRERATFTGDVLGQWLAFLRDRGHDTNRFVLNVVDDFSVTLSFGGHVPSQATLQGRAKLFEVSFKRRYGTSIQAVLEAREMGGVR